MQSSGISHGPASGANSAALLRDISVMPTMRGVIRRRGFNPPPPPPIIDSGVWSGWRKFRKPPPSRYHCIHKQSRCSKSMLVISAYLSNRPPRLSERTLVFGAASCDVIRRRKGNYLACLGATSRLKRGRLAARSGVCIIVLHRGIMAAA